MKSYFFLVARCAVILLVVGLLAQPLSAEEPAPATQKAAAQTQPAIPQAYQLDVRNVLTYQVVSTTRVGAAPPTTAKYREMVVLDIDGEENLVMYIGSPDLKSLAAAASAAQASPAGSPHSAERRSPEHRPAAAPGEHKQPAAPERKPTAAEEAEKVQMVWTKHVLGKTFTRNADGTISFRPAEGEVMPYPVLPLPPADLKEKGRFELTLPDLALGEGKTIAVTGTCKVAPEGKVTVDCRLEPKVVPGGIPELAVMGYDIPAGATAVSAVRMTRRLASEPASQPARESGEVPAPRKAERGERPARPAAGVPQAQPLTSLMVQLLNTKQVTQELHTGLVGRITAAVPSGESDTAAAPAGEGAVEKSKPVTGNLWDQVEQIGSQNKEKTEGATK